MKTLIDENVIINLKPSILKDLERDLMGAEFKWGIFAKPEILTSSEDEVTVKLPKILDEKSKKESLKHVHIMRLFSLHIVKQLIENKEQLDQDFYTKINFKIDENVKELMVEKINELEFTVLNEIFFHHNPIKPTKKEIKKIEL